MPPDTTQQLIDAAIAVGLGLMIGMEREHRDVSERVEEGARPDEVETLMGVRSFALLALFGWVAGALAQRWIWVAPAAIVAAAVIVAVPLLNSARLAAGLTTEIAALVTLLVGMLVSQDRAMAVVLGVMTTVLLISKPWFRVLVPRLRRADLTSTLQLVLALAVVLPLLPTDALDPWGALQPRRIGLFVSLILAVSWVGYVLARVLGTRRGAGLTGLVGGLVSSTAVTAAMAQRAAAAPAEHASGQLATFLACAMMSGRLLIITAVIAPSVALAASPAVGVIGVIILAGAALVWRDAKQSADRDVGGAVQLENPMKITSALKWGAFMSIVLVAAAAGQRFFGTSGVLASAAVSGLADVDAITLALARSAQIGGLSRDVAVTGIVIAVAVNTGVKAGIAMVTGGKAYGGRVVLIMGGALVAGLLVAVFV